MKALNLQNRTVALMENGSWAPSCARQMRALLEEMKSMEILEPVVTLKSALKDDSLAQLDALRDALIADCGLSGWQAPYIPEICAAPGITQDQLALRLHVNRSNVTRQLAMLEENGFVLRRRSESDRRAVEVYPTPERWAASFSGAGLWCSAQRRRWAAT